MLMPPPTSIALTRRNRPSSISAALAVVPPMSKLSRLKLPRRRASSAAPTTPAQFVRAAGVRIDQADRNGVDLRREDPIDDRVRTVFVQRALDAATVIDPLLDFESEPPGNQRRRLAPANVVEDGHAQTADLE